MKKYILIIGLVLLGFNTIIGFLVSSYYMFNVVLVDINLVLSIVMLLILYSSKIESSYKITLALIFVFTGFIRVSAALTSTNIILDNPVIIGILVILGIEIIITLIAHSVKKIS
jgi:hypothetical protein